MATTADSLQILEELRKRHQKLKAKYRDSTELLTKALKTIEELELQASRQANKRFETQTKSVYEVVYGNLHLLNSDGQSHSLGSQLQVNSGNDDREIERLRLENDRLKRKMEDQEKKINGLEESLSQDREKNDTERGTDDLKDAKLENKRLQRLVDAQEIEIKQLKEDMNRNNLERQRNQEMTKGNSNDEVERLKRYADAQDKKIKTLQDDLIRAREDLKKELQRESPREIDSQRRPASRRQDEGVQAEKERERLEKENRELVELLEQANKEKNKKVPERSRLVESLGGSFNLIRSIQAR